MTEENPLISVTIEKSEESIKVTFYSNKTDGDEFSIDIKHRQQQVDEIFEKLELLRKDLIKDEIDENEKQLSLVFEDEQPKNDENEKQAEPKKKKTKTEILKEKGYGNDQYERKVLEQLGSLEENENIPLTQVDENQ